MTAKYVWQGTNLQSSTVASGSIAHKCNFLHAFTAKRELSTMWIINSRASDHITRHIDQLSIFQPCDRNWTIKIANGSLSRVVGTGPMRVYIGHTQMNNH